MVTKLWSCEHECKPWFSMVFQWFSLISTSLSINLVKNLFMSSSSPNLIRNYLQVRPFLGRSSYRHGVFSNIKMTEDVMLLRCRIFDFFINFIFFFTVFGHTHSEKTMKNNENQCNINAISMNCTDLQSEYAQTQWKNHEIY